MSDMISTFIDAIVGDDPEVRKELEAARLRLEAGREIHLLRKELNLSVDDFAKVLGIDREEVEKLEIGNFEESGNQKIIEVNKKIRAWLAADDELEQEQGTATTSASVDLLSGRARASNHQGKFTA